MRTLILENQKIDLIQIFTANEDVDICNPFFSFSSSFQPSIIPNEHKRASFNRNLWFGTCAKVCMFQSALQLFLNFQPNFRDAGRKT